MLCFLLFSMFPYPVLQPIVQPIYVQAVPSPLGAAAPVAGVTLPQPYAAGQYLTNMPLTATNSPYPLAPGQVAPVLTGVTAPAATYVPGCPGVTLGQPVMPAPVTSCPGVTPGQSVRLPLGTHVIWTDATGNPVPQDVRPPVLTQSAPVVSPPQVPQTPPPPASLATTASVPVPIAPMPAAPDSLSFVAPVVAPRTPQVAPYPSVPRPRAPILRPRLPGVTPGSVVSSSGANAPYRPCPKYASAERAESSVSGTTCAPSEASSTPRFHRGRRLQRGEGRAAFAPRNRSLTPRRPVRSVSQTTQDRVPKQQRKGCLISSCTTTFSHIERHFLYDHLPWYAAPLTACWLCGEQCTQSAKLDRHWSANHEGVSQSVNWNKERLEDYLKRVDCLLQFLASKQQPRARNVHELYDRLQDSEQLKVCMAKVSIPPGVWEAFCSQHSLPVPAEGFKLNPSNSPAVLLYWRSLAALVMPLNRRDREQVRTIAAAVTTVSGASSSQTASQVTPQPEPVPMDTSESTQTDASVPEPSAQAEPTVSAPAEVSGCPPDSASTETTAFVTDSLNVRTVAEVVVEGGSGGPIRRERE